MADTNSSYGGIDSVGSINFMIIGFIGIAILIRLFMYAFGMGKTYPEQEEEKDCGYIPEVEQYRIEKENEELNRIENDIILKERRLNLRDRKRKIIKRKYGSGKNESV